MMSKDIVVPIGFDLMYSLDVENPFLTIDLPSILNITAPAFRSKSLTYSDTWNCELIDNFNDFDFLNSIL